MSAATLGALPLVAAIKLAGYWPWCALGQRLLAAPARGAARALGLAAARLGVGLVLGWSLTWAHAALWPATGRVGLHLPAFAASLAVLRWLEWSAIGLLARRSTERAWVGRDARERWWRVGGVAVSFATDAATVLAVGALGWIPC